MLSRVADSIYWMSRYVERAENVARFVDVNLNLMLDAPNYDQQWQPLINITGDHADFAERYGPVATAENVLEFLTFDRLNPNSIISCLCSARENARSVREIISSEMWLQLNTFYLTVNEAAEANNVDSPNRFFQEVKLASHLFTGITDATMTHGEAWHFSRVARMLERADKTSRILDVKYFILLRSVAEVGTIYDDVQWAAVLRSASAFEMYRKHHGRILPPSIVHFLLLNTEFPRAVRFCTQRAEESLAAISGKEDGPLAEVCETLARADVDVVIAEGLHEYIDALQIKLNVASAGIYEHFFAPRVPRPGRNPMSQMQ